MRYTPDRWVVLKIKSKEFGIIYKILASWVGGYTQGQSWKLNSGIKSIVENKESYLVTGYTGSVYECYKNLEGMNIYMANVLGTLKESYKDQATFKEITMNQYKGKKRGPSNAL